jgi:hypothetical protein
MIISTFVLYFLKNGQWRCSSAQEEALHVTSELPCTQHSVIGGLVLVCLINPVLRTHRKEGPSQPQRAFYFIFFFLKNGDWREAIIIGWAKGV